MKSLISEFRLIKDIKSNKLSNFPLEAYSGVPLQRGNFLKSSFMSCIIQYTYYTRTLYMYYALSFKTLHNVEFILRSFDQRTFLSIILFKIHICRF